MKKTLVLASLLAAFGAASAQSSVTLYGYGDQGLGKAVVANLLPTATAAQIAAHDAAVKLQLNPNTSDVGGLRIGIKGTESLGGGMSAKFQLESNSILGDTGGGAFDFSRAAWFGLAGSMGEVRLGRHATIAVINSGTQTNFGWRGTNSQVALGLRAGIDCQTATCTPSSRESAAITFLSANYSGLTFAAQTTLKADGYYGATKGATQFAVGYAAGALKVEANTTNMGGPKTSYVGAQYNFGGVTGALGFMGTNDGLNTPTSKNAGITARAKATFGAIDAGLEVTKQTKNAKRTGVELGMDYNLSPRTALTAAVNKTTDYSTGVFAGVRHAF
jgi:general bacterial porin, GBP family